MAADKFRQAEDEYFKLRGQFDTGRLTQEQFDEKLRELMQQDAQGRYWMLGADSAKWYYYDGTKWVQSDPYPGSMPPPVIVAAAAPPVSAPVSPPPPSAPAAAVAKERSFPIIPVLVIILLLILGAVGFLIFQNRDRIFVAQAPNQITPILPPTITRAPSPTALSALPTLPQPTLVQPTLAPLATAVPTATPITANPTQVPTNPPDAPTPAPSP